MAGKTLDHETAPGRLDGLINQYIILFQFALILYSGQSWLSVV